MRHKTSLDADYFEGIFAADDDPWGIESKPYEAAKFDRSVQSIADRRYALALEIGCAQGVLTHRLASLCDRLVAIDISATALTRAARRCSDDGNVAFEQMAYPQATPTAEAFDLVVLSEVAYYWDASDLALAAAHLQAATAPDGRILLVHWTGETDYPQSGDDAVEGLWAALGTAFRVERRERHEGYRLDLWRRA